MLIDALDWGVQSPLPFAPALNATDILLMAASSMRADQGSGYITRGYALQKSTITQGGS